MSLILPLLLLFRCTWFGDTGHPMANGQMPFPGAAACSSDFPIGTVIGLSGKSGWLDVVCLDRGHLNSRHWVDVYAATPEEGAVIARNFSPYAYGQIIRSGP